MSLLIDSLITVCNVSTIGLCGFMKVPQILAIIRARSTKGLSLAALCLELTSYSIMLSYNIYSGYAFSSYFEYPLMVTQDVVMLVVFLSFTGRLSPAVLVPAVGASYFAFSIASGSFPHALITTLVGLCTPISASSKVVALVTIIRLKNSATVSVSSLSISAYTCLTRLFTIYVESADPALLMNFGTSLMLNICLITAALVYKPRVKKE
ncbi:solute carrier family 66 member 3-like [Eriocheir sinensis]|uniref:solute carrier family 66 member 3-like n=1 Tax=Eriocheir sinensis TaxID=95602 RepID=UPI0021C9D9D4|nr:solute carrier family 66 member 3-like [Eriocheir sinensis]XP_050727836.1 solute carrier family 66 member 3-like [Eriocheir sinensis]